MYNTCIREYIPAIAAGFFRFMDNNLNFGSGSQLLGGTDPLQEAMARRQTGQAGITAQTSPAGGGQPMPVPPQ